MKIVLTLSGNSERFTSQGYPIKPLIKIHGRTILNYVLSVFPNVADDNFIFIVKNEDLASSNIKQAILTEKQSKICAVPKNSLGPVYSISHAFEHIPDDEEIVVSYCDLSQQWNFDKFLQYCRNSNSDGCVVTHVGQHPHKFYNTSFAFLTVDGEDVKYIHEKKPIKDVAPNEPASNGIYYFKSGKIMKHYFRKLMDEKLAVNGEYYVTVPYNLMIKDGLKVTHYNTDNYVCLGTPADVICFDAWLNILKYNNLTASDAEFVFKYWQKHQYVESAY